MAYSKKLIHFLTKDNFEKQLKDNNILDTSICFIKDAKQIWTHGQYYSCPYTEEEINLLFVGSNILLTDYVEMASPINILATDTVNEAFSKLEEYLSSLDELNAVLVDTGDVAEDPTFNDYISPAELHSALMEYATLVDLETKVSEITIPTKVSELDNDVPYLTEHQDISHLATKDEVSTAIADLVDSAPETLNTLNELATAISEHQDVTDTLDEAITGKQDKGLKFTNLTASSWVEDSTYSDYPYRCDLACDGVTETNYAEVVFSLTDAVSGNYAPICETKDGIVSIWGAVNEEIIIPTILIVK